MLIRQLQKPGDYERAVLAQNENIRQAIANDANISAARKNASMGIIPEVTPYQQRTRAEQQLESSDAKITAMNHLREIFTENQVKKFMGTLTSDAEIEFINVYWGDIKNELATKDVIRMTIPYFTKVLRKVMDLNTAQAGLSTNPSNGATADSLNEVSELKKVLPDRKVIVDIYNRLHDNRQPGANDYKLLAYMLPNEQLYANLSAATPAIRQEVIHGVMVLLRGLNPNTNYWKALLATQPTLAFIRAATQAYPVLDNRAILNLYDKVDPRYSTYVSATMRKDIGKTLSASVSTSASASANQSKIISPPPPKFGRGVKSGKGIAPKPREYHDLGKFLIDGTELEKQVLSIKYQSGAPVPDFTRKTAMSDNLHELVKELIETQKLNKSLMKELDSGERRAFESLLIRSGVGVGLGIKEVTPTHEDKAKMERFKLLQGSFNAGNNSKDLIQELRSLVLYFLNSGRLSKKEALNTLQMLA
jgi:hypothetical protein